MLLIQDGLSIAEAKKDQNLFVLDFATLRKIMQTNVIMTIRKRRPVYLVICSKKV